MSQPNIPECLHSREDFLQLFQMEQISERITSELKNGVIYIASNVDDNTAKSYVVAAKETKSNVSKDDTVIINNALTLLHLDDWLFETEKPNSRHIRLTYTNGLVYFQAIESGKETYAINVSGLGMFSVLWGTFIECCGSIAAESLRQYEALAIEWRKNQS